MFKDIRVLDTVVCIKERPGPSLSAIGMRGSKARFGHVGREYGVTAVDVRIQDDGMYLQLRELGDVWVDSDRFELRQRFQGKEKLEDAVERFNKIAAPLDAIIDTAASASDFQKELAEIEAYLKGKGEPVLIIQLLMNKNNCVTYKDANEEIEANMTLALSVRNTLIQRLRKGIL